MARRPKRWYLRKVKWVGAIALARSLARLCIGFSILVSFAVVFGVIVVVIVEFGE
jgi:hypothetical protein